MTSEVFRGSRTSSACQSATRLPAAIARRTRATSGAPTRTFKRQAASRATAVAVASRVVRRSRAFSRHDATGDSRATAPTPRASRAALSAIVARLVSGAHRDSAAQFQPQNADDRINRAAVRASTQLRHRTAAMTLRQRVGPSARRWWTRGVQRVCRRAKAAVASGKCAARTCLATRATTTVPSTARAASGR